MLNRSSNLDIWKALKPEIGHLCVLIMISGIGLLPIAATYAQEDSVKVAKIDDREIAPRYPEAKHIEEFRNNRDYQYSDDPQPPDNPMEKWISWLMRKLSQFFSEKSYENFWQYLIMITAAALVLFLLYKAKVLEYIFPAGNIKGTHDYIIGQENIHEIDFEESIGSALEKGDFRLAIRLQYLKILKQLNTRGLIHWKPNLTNQNYVRELEKYPFHADFVKITRYFEFAWYGDFQIDESGFKEMKDFSNSFQEKILI